MKSKKQSINSLMRYMRDEKNINITGSHQKKQLMNIGYFHGFKGYRFVKNPNNTLSYNNFDELMSVYNFDMNVKSILYPYIMSIETAFKSHAIETCIELCSNDFTEIYETLLNKHLQYEADSKKYKDALKLKLKLRNIIYNTISDAYNREGMEHKNRMISHYQHQGKQVPIWAIFEILSLGQFGIFLQVMRDDTSQRLAKNLNIYYNNIDQNGRLPESIVFFLTDLRNAIAHNSIVFDCRFMKSNPAKQIKFFISKETGIDCEFEYLNDYIVMIAAILLKLGYSKTDVKRLVRNYFLCVENLRKEVPIEIYNKILGTETKNIVNKLLIL